MIYRTILAAPKESPFRDQIAEAMPFIADPASLNLAVDLVKNSDPDDVTSMFIDFRMPHDTVWIEFDVDAGFIAASEHIAKQENLKETMDGFRKIGFLIEDHADGIVSIYPFTTDYRTGHTDPIAGVQFSLATGEAKGFGLDGLREAKVAKLVLAGSGTDEANDFIDRFRQFELNISFIGGVLSSRLFTLMASKDAPLDQVEENAMSRPERRRLQRSGMSEADLSREVTRIVLNQEGRNHMRAIEGNDEAGAPRRGHWVRGHLKRTESKGLVWWRSHVRGFGDPAMRPRVVTADSGPDMEM